ncbi:MAG: CsgG/HfaB family protein, partial [Elusimicrobiota bacterium]
MKTLAISLALLVAQTGFAFAASPAGAESMEKISKKLSRGLKEGSRLAVLEFPYTDGKSSEGPAIVQERLTTALAANRKISLIERALLAKVLGELKLQASGAIDEDTAKKLGKLLGADAIVTGTLNDLKEGRVELNARVVDAATAKILTAASGPIEKTWKDGPPAVTVRPADFGKRPLVQLAILLDTSGSMDGLINQARSQLWKIVNELVGAEKSGSSPVIEVALYEYGNSGLSQEKGYMRQVLPFTRDMDKVAQELFALTTNGGDEYAGMAIKSAVRDLAWSGKDDVYKAIFIAGNEPFTQGPVDFREAAGLAKGKGIFVNTIFCGPRQQGVATRWQEGAQLAGGDYSNIDQSISPAYVEAPQDARIAQLGASLGNTSVVRGVRGSVRKAELNSLESKMSASGGQAA